MGVLPVVVTIARLEDVVLGLAGAVVEHADTVVDVLAQLGVRKSAGSQTLKQNELLPMKLAERSE